MKLLKYIAINLCIIFLSSLNSQVLVRESYHPQKLKKTMTDDYWHYHNAGNLGLTITNFGVIGEGYNNPDQPSCMYKLYTDNIRKQIEHLSFGGLWIGGRGGVDGGIHVSTAIIDGVFDAGEEGFEFTNSSDPGDTIRTRSTIPTSPSFDPYAVSHQDYVCDFTDVNTTVPGTQFEIPNHTPLGLLIHMESYAWNFAYTDAFVILNYTITNISGNPISDIYAGIWADAAVGNMNYTSIYEPGGAWSWYDNMNGFDDNYKMAYQYDDNGDDGFAESYFGMRFLGSTGQQENIQVNYDQWQWTQSASTVYKDYVMPLDDAGRYKVMQGRHTGKYHNAVDAGGYPTDPAEAASWMLVLSAGSLGNLAPGESMDATFAIVCGEWANKDELDTAARRATLRLNSDWAQIAYNGEDVDGDGKLDPNEDINNNNILDPGEDEFKPELDTNANGRWDLGEPVFGDGDGVLDIEEDVYTNSLSGITANNGVINRFILPSPPPSPTLHVESGKGQVTLFWDNLSEEYEDPITREKDFEGYKIYSATKTAGSNAENTILAQFDKINNLGYDTGFDLIQADTVIDGHTYNYRFTNKNLLNGWPSAYWFSVTAYDQGNPDNNLPSLESSILENKTYAIPGSNPAFAQSSKVTVFPNPYKAHALWDGNGDRDRMLWFANLPRHCKIRIFTLAGDMVDEFEHNGDTYTGSDVRILSERIGNNSPVLSGGMHAWDLITSYDQAIATGLYLYSVEDSNSGDTQVGKFVVIK